MAVPSKNAKKQLKPKKINQIKIGFLQKGNGKSISID